MSWVAALLLPGGLLFLAFSYRYAWWVPAISYRRPRILMYHMVSEQKPGQKFKGLRVTPDRFEQQVCYLKRNGWNFVTMSELMASTSHIEKTVAITFDDGYEDNYLNAFPILKRHQAKATLYLVVDRHDRDWSVNKKAHHNSGELAREAKLTDEQIVEMVESGVFELGAHTLTHVNLHKADRELKTREIADSKTQLETMFGVAVDSFAYPFGIYDQQDVAIAAQSGYTSSVTTIAGIDEDLHADPYQLKRVKISGKDNHLAFMLRMKTGKRGYKK